MWPFKKRYREVIVTGSIILYHAKDRLIIDLPISEEDMGNFRTNAERGIKSLQIQVKWKD